MNNNPTSLNPLLDSIEIKDIVSIAKLAGDAIMEIYKKDFTVEYKDDKSPLTEADTKSNEIIIKGLQSLSPEPGILNPELSALPILSEEGKEIPYEERKHWEYYWCIDPIDGTKEFIKKNGEFTVNIALIHKDTPVLGVVYAPALGDMYWAVKGKGAYKAMVNDEFWMLNEEERAKSIKKLPLYHNSDPENQLTIVASKSHLSEETQEFIDHLTFNIQHPTFISKGSSLKLVMVAEGSADIYPRLAPTMEWDTAAADAIVREAGKMTYQYNPEPRTLNAEPLKYNKENLLNPWFVVK
jgi:3'(2'), 5'-bisphosphate nucleotidase